MFGHVKQHGLLVYQRVAKTKAKWKYLGDENDEMDIGHGWDMAGDLGNGREIVEPFV